MVCEGMQLSFNWTFCIECGEKTSNLLPKSSGFYRYVCLNKECAMRGAAVTVEKCSNVVFSVNPPYIIDGKPAWPSVDLMDYNGKVVWTRDKNV